MASGRKLAEEKNQMHMKIVRMQRSSMTKLLYAVEHIDADCGLLAFSSDAKQPHDI